MEPTTSVPWVCEMSKHSMRRGGSARPKASAISSSARFRVVRSEARLAACCCRDSSALRSTVSRRVRLSPRTGTRTSTRAPRIPSSRATSSGSAGTELRISGGGGFSPV